MELRKRIVHRTSGYELSNPCAIHSLFCAGVCVCVCVSACVDGSSVDHNLLIDGLVHYH
jgi:hypothetical protein